MKATYDKNAKTKWTTSHRKEGKCFFSSMQVVSLSGKPHPDGCLDSRIECRLYGTGNLNTCCLWVRGVGQNGECTQGSGQAGGYGYHRPSEAMSRAIENAGFKLSKDIGGVGESAMREALLAIARCLKIKRPAIIESHP